MIFPTTNTCPNTLPYPYDVHSWAEYAFNFVIIFKYVSEKNYDTRPIPSVYFFRILLTFLWLIMDIVIVYPAHYRTTVGQWLDVLVSRRYIGMGVQLHGMHNDQNLTPVDFYMKSLVYTEVILLRNIFEYNYEIKRIFSPRVNVIGIRKCVRACIRRREDHFELNFAN
ncbi:hypothetical protein SFRURICE_007843 [Spodoptera frugiperda]|nr:hypothetical protein SFRURICE_007843 [Spodoptera frugiperda]